MRRREFLAAGAAALLAAGCAGVPPAASEPGPGPARPAAPPGPLGPIFDAHTHVTVGLGGIRGAGSLRKAMTEAGAEGALVMASSLGGSGDDVAALERIAEHLAPLGPLVPFAGVHPDRSAAAEIDRLRDAAKRGVVRGLKVFLGYVRAWANDARYQPFYKLAAEQGLVVMFHTGDTSQRTAHVKYAQPVTIDEVAVAWPSVKFILAHLGNPWTLEAAEVVYKNPNVHADVSAFAVGDEDWFAAGENQEVLADVVARVRQAFLYAEAPERFLFGSDWPLVPMRVYRDLMRRAIPERHQAAVFRGNARKMFGV